MGAIGQQKSAAKYFQNFHKTEAVITEKLICFGKTGSNKNIVVWFWTCLLGISDSFFFF
jgi:hypothetical protein